MHLLLLLLLSAEDWSNLKLKQTFHSTAENFYHITQ